MQNKLKSTDRRDRGFVHLAFHGTEGGRRMLKHQLLSPEGILVLEPADFQGLAREIDPSIAEHGKRTWAWP